MPLESMSFGEYKWKNNPRKIEISQERNVVEQVIPFFGNELQDFGRKKKIVKGSGEFFGPDALEQYNELYDVFSEGGIHYLSIPKIAPFLARFSSINLVENPNPNVVDYKFEFWECLFEDVTANTSNYPDFHTVLNGESIWSIASMYSKSVEEILRLNPQIKTPESIVVGQKVALK